MQSKLEQLAALGQSIWIDYMRRAFITSGELAALIDMGLRGATSNPSIFEKAISGSNDYDHDVESLSAAGLEAIQIYEHLALQDIGMAAEAFLPVYQASGGLDGYVSLEVDPQLAMDQDGTVAQAERLFGALGRPNVMIKVPATNAGYPAIERLIGMGLNINVTLIFSVEQYEQVVQAYMAGLERWTEGGGDPRRVASVASFFVSRLDRAVDDMLEERGHSALKGRAAIANAKMAYARAEEIYASPRWQALAERGAQRQRLLWASTSTKDPSYPDTLYVDSLIGEGTVNTVPPATLQAFLDRGGVEPSLAAGLQEAMAHLERLDALGIDLAAVNARLLEEGLDAFAQAFTRMLDSIRAKMQDLRRGRQWIATELDGLHGRVIRRVNVLSEERVSKRIWQHDHTLWSPDPAEISSRLGWLHSPERWAEQASRMVALRQSLRREGVRNVVLLGMGGSSLAAQVLARVFRPSPDGLGLRVFDTVDPVAISDLERELDFSSTAFLVATKSGTTVETLSLFNYFYTKALQALGGQAAQRFIAITDPGGPLARMAERLGLRRVWLNDPDIGGRYSALSAFGLLPAALLGVDVVELLERGQRMMVGCDHCVAADGHPGILLGAAMGELALAGKDKLTLLAIPSLRPFGAWVEQLVAESTGKDGKGILPIVDEPRAPVDVYGEDRVFCALQLEGEPFDPSWIKALRAAGHAVVTLELRDLLDLGAQFYLWEYAVAVAGMILAVHPFNQPDVEAAKALARQAVEAYKQEGTLPLEPPVLVDGQVQVWVADPATLAGDTALEALQAFLGQVDPAGYVCLQAYLPPSPEMDAALTRLREAILLRTSRATSSGYGPRYLHSTGQLHKGDGGKGSFIQLTSADPLDLPIPDEPGLHASTISFGVLKAAQAQGDRKALVERGRRLLHVHLLRDPVQAINDLAGGLRG